MIGESGIRGDLSFREQYGLRFTRPPLVPGGSRRTAGAGPQSFEPRLIGGKRLEEIEQHVRQLEAGRKQQSVVAVTHTFGKARAVVEGAHGHARAEQIGHFHRNVESR